MAWKWFWNTETKYYDEAITRDTDWGGDESTGGLAVSGGRVQEWLKNEINGKYGVIRVSSSIDERNYYSLEMFATVADEELYDSNPEQYAELVTRVPIPISAVQGDTYASLLATSFPISADVVVATDTFNVPLNFRAVRITSLDKINMNTRGTLLVQRSTDNGSSWVTSATLPNVLPSEEYANTDNYTEVNLSSYLVEGKQMFRVRASYEYEDETTGETKNVNSSWVLIGNTVTKTQLRVELNRNFETPIQAYNAVGQANPFPLEYFVYGAVAKTLHIELQGSVATMTITKELTADIDSTGAGVPSVAEDEAYGILTHGVHRVKAWMTASDGLGGTITSNVLVNRLMVVNPNTPNADLTKPYLLLQNVDDKVTNYVQTEICQYAVYSPITEDGVLSKNGPEVNIAFLLTEYTDDYETSDVKEYFRVEQKAAPNKQYSLLSTVEIEAEEGVEEQKKYDVYFRVRRVTEDGSTDFMKESTNETYYSVEVDNSESFSPVSGATFLLNPKIRNNTENNPARILNARDNNAEVYSEWEGFGFVNDGWITASDGQKVLRVPAGAKLKIARNPFAQYLTTPNSAMTIEIDFAVHNVTNESDPVIDISETIEATGGYRGLRMNALDGWLRSTSYANSNDTLFSWDEDTRTHISVNLHHNVRPNKGDVYYPSTAENPDGTMALARVLVNGDPYREFPFNTVSASEWTSNADNMIVIGNEGAVIDIYSIRIYEDKAIEMTDILNRNYVATQPTADAKLTLRNRNNILTAGRIDIEKAKQLGINCMVWHGELPYFYSQSAQTGWYEIFRYDDNGNYLPEYSGTICKETKSLSDNGQGSTAKTYYDWNEQDDQSKVTATIQVSLDKIHSSIHVRIEGDKAYIYGGNLGKNFPVENIEVEYPYANGFVTVPDGWVDGNGMYRGMGYQVAPNTSLAQKKVFKINYASSMQSHLLAACKTYDLLHRKVVGDTPLQKVVPTAVSAKHTEPFMLFSQSEGSANVYYKGMGNYGAGKMDKVTWGYVKKLHPMFALIEGSDNNLPMTGFRVPFDKKTAVYAPDDEGWLYNGQQNFDFDAGATVDPATQPDWQFNLGKETEVPSIAIRDRWAEIHNFIYLHAPHLRYFVGTFAQFRTSEDAKNHNYKYWCTAGDDAFRVYRYDYLADSWIDAGLLDEATDTYRMVNLKTDVMTKAVHDAAVAAGTVAQYKELNTAFNNALAAHFKKYAKYFMSTMSLRFNYAYVLSFMAGTDNSDKNTYYKLMPYAEDMSADATTTDGADFAAWFSAQYGKEFNFAEVYQLYFDGDDMDSILRTNNNSHQTKPYYIDRMHPYADDNAEECLYEGTMNALFNLCELAYEPTGELASTMNAILAAATELVREDDRFFGLTDNRKSAWGFLHKYFFNTQYYFPQIAYIEQARIRYEFPELIGFVSQGAGARQIRPITQSLGSQLQNELAYMKKRLIYMASYANFGAFFGNTTYSIGLADAADTLSWMPSVNPDGTNANYVLTLKPHQYIYPTGAIGQTNINPHVRVSPHETYDFTIATNQGTSDTGISLMGINYYSSVGNFGNISVQPTRGFTVVGKRLTEFIANPTKLYDGKAAFRPQSIEVKAPQLKQFSLAGCTEIGGACNLTLLTRCRTIDLSTTAIYDVMLPASELLESVHLGANIQKFEIKDTPRLSTLSFGGYSSLKSLVIGDNVGNVDTQTLIVRLRDAYEETGNIPDMVSIHDVRWTNVSNKMMDFLCVIPKADITGSISIFETSTSIPSITFEKKLAIIKKFGDVDNPNSHFHKGLLLTYLQREINDSSVLKGNFYPSESESYPLDFPFYIYPNSSFANTVSYIEWYIGDDGFNSSEGYINPVTGVLTVTKASDEYDTVEVKARVDTYYDGVVGSFELSKTIEVYNRQVQLGDFVYYDGTYGSPDTYSGEKTVVGVCFYIAPRDADGNIVSELFNPDDKQKRLMVALQDLEITADDGTKYANVTFKPSAGNCYTTDESGTKVLFTSGDLTTTTFYTPATVVPFTGGWSASLAKTAWSDTTELALINDGFKVQSANGLLGAGLAYGETATNLAYRTLSKEMAALAGKGYKEGDIVNRGYADTLLWIQHRNKILQNGIPEIGLTPDMAVCQVPQASSGNTELNSLANLCRACTLWNTETGAATNLQRIYFMWISMAYGYEPKVKTTEQLADKFKAHNWFGAPQGLLYRMWVYQLWHTENIFAKAAATGVYVNFVQGRYYSTSTPNYYGERESLCYFNANQCVSQSYAGAYYVRPICAF
ncbi:MAG: hypothetical protein IKL03_08415 [Bacteroidaceae bacterium]|nr:hypothetical protein [Bacteroidaceae bacterium]